MRLFAAIIIHRYCLPSLLLYILLVQYFAYINISVVFGLILLFTISIIMNLILSFVISIKNMHVTNDCNPSSPLSLSSSRFLELYQTWNELLLSKLVEFPLNISPASMLHFVTACAPVVYYLYLTSSTLYTTSSRSRLFLEYPQHYLEFEINIFFHSNSSPNFYRALYLSYCCTSWSHVVTVHYIRGAFRRDITRRSGTKMAIVISRL